MDAAALKTEHVHICGVAPLCYKSTGARKNNILETLAQNGTLQGANAGARVEGFETNASQNTRRSCPQLINFCLE